MAAMEHQKTRRSKGYLQAHWRDADEEDSPHKLLGNQGRGTVAIGCRETREEGDNSKLVR